MHLKGKEEKIQGKYWTKKFEYQHRGNVNFCSQFFILLNYGHCIDWQSNESIKHLRITILKIPIFLQVAVSLRFNIKIKKSFFSSFLFRIFIFCGFNINKNKLNEKTVEVKRKVFLLLPQGRYHHKIIKFYSRKYDWLVKEKNIKFLFVLWIDLISFSYTTTMYKLKVEVDVVHQKKE